MNGKERPTQRGGRYTKCMHVRSQRPKHPIITRRLRNSMEGGKAPESAQTEAQGEWKKTGPRPGLKVVRMVIAWAVGADS